MELCGGTHVGHTGELGFFKIKHETAIAAGVRRIEAVSGAAAEDFVNSHLHELHAAKLLLKNPKEFAKSIEQLQQENSDLKKQFERLEARQLAGIKNELLGKIVLLNGVAFIGEIIEVSNGDALKKICTDLKTELTAPYAVVLCTNIGGKASVAVMYQEDNTLDASKTIKQHIAPLIKGGGGGSKSLATAGGQEVGNLQAVIEMVKGLL